MSCFFFVFFLGGGYLGGGWNVVFFNPRSEQQTNGIGFSSTFMVYAQSINQSSCPQGPVSCFFLVVNIYIQKGSGSTRPEFKSASESSRPWVNSARCIFRAFSIHVHVYAIRFGFCIIFWTKSKINIY